MLYAPAGVCRYALPRREELQRRPGAELLLGFAKPCVILQPSSALLPWCGVNCVLWVPHPQHRLRGAGAVRAGAVPLTAPLGVTVTWGSIPPPALAAAGVRGSFHSCFGAANAL